MSVYDKGGFARICVEVDLKQPLLPTYVVFGEERLIIYEGLHQVCLACGKYGHQKNICPLHSTQEANRGDGSGNAVVGTGGDERKDVEQKTGPDGGKDVEQKTGPDGGQELAKNEESKGGDPVHVGGGVPDSPHFGKIRILRREFKGQLIQNGLRKEITKIEDQAVKQINKDQRLSRRIDSKQDDRGVMKGIQSVVIKDNGPQKEEWIQVGSKRKNGSKGKVKGKENKPPARNRVARPVGLNSRPNVSLVKDNPFDVLQGKEAQVHLAKSDSSVIQTQGISVDVPSCSQQPFPLDTGGNLKITDGSLQELGGEELGTQPRIASASTG
ncbi:hypothetical protein K1719_013563 [Acacia pycnantha]|nr:hypothetical protein K1719_013563 [Acacia pycnantha]